jgi:hypothetical protein
MAPWEVLHPGIIRRELLDNVPITHYVHRLERRRGFFGVSVMCGLGFAHDTCIGPDGRRYTVPVGGAHLLEHALTAEHFRSHFRPVEQAGGKLAVRTSADRMTWSVPFFVVDDPAERRDRIAATARHLLAVLADPVDEQSLARQVRREATVVEAEWLHRHNDPRYRLHIALTESLYPNHHIGRDPLGHRGSVAEVTLAELRPALQALRRNVRAVTIITAMDERLVTAVLGALDPLCATVSVERWQATAAPPLRHDPRRLNVLDDPYAPEDYGTAAVGLRLPGLRHAFPGHLERAKALVACEALAAVPGQWASLPWQASADARTFGSIINIRPPWLEEMDCEDVLEAHRKRIRRSLGRASEYAERVVSSGVMKIVETIQGFLRLAHRADIHDLALPELLEAAPDVDSGEFERLADEMICAKGAVAYRGPALG